MKEQLAKLKDPQVVLWAVAFVGVCILVGLGKLKPETIEYLLFALLGKVSSSKKEKGNE